MCQFYHALIDRLAKFFKIIVREGREREKERVRVRERVTMSEREREAEGEGESQYGRAAQTEDQKTDWNKLLETLSARQGARE